METCNVRPQLREKSAEPLSLSSLSLSLKANSLPAAIGGTFRKASCWELSTLLSHRIALKSLVYFQAGGPFSIPQQLPRLGHILTEFARCCLPIKHKTNWKPGERCVLWAICILLMVPPVIYSSTERQSHNSELREPCEHDTEREMRSQPVPAARTGERCSCCPWEKQKPREWNRGTKCLAGAGASPQADMGESSQKCAASFTYPL